MDTIVDFLLNILIIVCYTSFFFVVTKAFLHFVKSANEVCEEVEKTRKCDDGMAKKTWPYIFGRIIGVLILIVILACLILLTGMIVVSMLYLLTSYYNWLF